MPQGAPLLTLLSLPVCVCFSGVEGCNVAVDGVQLAARGAQAAAVHCIPTLRCPLVPPPCTAPQDKLFKSYIEMELQLGNIDRCRTLYQKYIEWHPANAGAWGRFAELERSLGEAERARAVYELAFAQPVLDMPEVLWKVRGRGVGVEVWCGVRWSVRGGGPAALNPVSIPHLADCRLPCYCYCCCRLAGLHRL